MHGKGGGKTMALVSQSELAGKIIKLTAMRLDTKLPWLTEAIHLPECSFDLKQTSGTDGSRLCWNTEEVCQTYAEDPVLLERRYLHLILHLLYLHPYRRKKETEYLWWLACDLLTEYRIDRMNIAGFERPSRGQKPDLSKAQGRKGCASGTFSGTLAGEAEARDDKGTGKCFSKR